LAVIGFVAYFFLRRKMTNTPVEPAVLKDKAVLITGCDTGFGNATALRLDAQNNVKVFAGCLTEKGVEELRSKGSERLVAFKLDVTKEASISDGVKHVQKNLESSGTKLWALINNAGILRSGINEVATPDDWSLQFSVNVFGMAAMCRHFTPLMRQCADSRIINIASVVGRFAMPGLGAYTASKHAVEGFSDSLRRELKTWGISVVIIEPGVMKTPLYQVQFSSELDRMFNSYSEDVQRTYGKEYFGDMLKRFRETHDRLGGDPVKVVDALQACVNSKYPPHRLAVGNDTPLWLTLSYLPTWISDPLVHLTGSKALPAALKEKRL